MINEYIVRGAFKDAKIKGKPLAMYMNDEGTELFDSETDEFVCTIETYTKYLREKFHCYVSLYYEHVKKYRVECKILFCSAFSSIG